MDNVKERNLSCGQNLDKPESQYRERIDKLRRNTKLISNYGRTQGVYKTIAESRIFLFQKF